MSDSRNATSLQDLYQGGIRISQAICAIVTTPVEYALRPFFGTRYFDPIQMMFTCILMSLLPLLGGLTSFLPTGSVRADSASGIVGLGTLSALFLIGSAIHAPRLWRRIFHMELEGHSMYEGNALPFFALLPLGNSFWAVRVLWEPLFVALIAIGLRLVTVLDRPAMIFLLASAVCLFFKNHLCWYQNWLQLRTLMDTKLQARWLPKPSSARRPKKNSPQVHMAGFAGSVPPEIRATAIAQMTPKMPALPPKSRNCFLPLSRLHRGQLSRFRDPARRRSKGC